jgi:predicted amino acid-binding ACT domain protein
MQESLMQQHERRWDEQTGPYRSGQEAWRTFPEGGERSGRSYNGGERQGRSGSYRAEGWDDDDFGRGYPERGWTGSRGREDDEFENRGRWGQPYGREYSESGRGYGREGYGRESHGREPYSSREGWGREGYGRESHGQGYGREGYGRESYGRESTGRYGYGGPSFRGEESYGQGYGRESFARSSYGGYRGEERYGEGFGRSPSAYRYGGQGTFRPEGQGGYRPESQWSRSGQEWAGGSQIQERRGPKNYKRSDERIREDVCDVLTDCDLNCEDVEVTVKEGEVTLSGTVQSREDRREMERIAERLPGVKDVTNQLRVKRESRTEHSDDKMKTAQSFSSERRGQTAMTSSRPE